MILFCRTPEEADSKKVGICGQVRSDYAEYAKFLVEEGIDLISLITRSRT